MSVSSMVHLLCSCHHKLWFVLQRESSEVEMSMQEVQDDRLQLAERLKQTTTELEMLQV